MRVAPRTKKLLENKIKFYGELPAQQGRRPMPVRMNKTGRESEQDEEYLVTASKRCVPQIRETNEQTAASRNHTPSPRQDWHLPLSMAITF
jgi:hypothetical protein